MGSVDVDTEHTLGLKFNICAYPTIKFIVNGHTIKRQYPGKRTVEELTQFVSKLVQDPVIEITQLEEFIDVDSEIICGKFIGYFNEKDQKYDSYRRVAMNFKENSTFYACFGDSSKNLHPGHSTVPTIIFHPDKNSFDEQSQTYGGNLSSFDELFSWIKDKNLSVVHQVDTKEYLDYLLDNEKLPLLILYHENNSDLVKTFKNIISTQLIDKKEKLIFIAINVSESTYFKDYPKRYKPNLAMIEIKNIEGCYVFPDFDDLYSPGKLNEFIDDFFLGKLTKSPFMYNTFQ
ncbi:endoplasmic reticulum resident protein 44-like [Cotesia glomerata]|nr:endoplasmic reticulum resident protein 44-like [Cotesia glomerata]